MAGPLWSDALHLRKKPPSDDFAIKPVREVEPDLVRRRAGVLRENGGLRQAADGLREHDRRVQPLHRRLPAKQLIVALLGLRQCVPHAAEYSQLTRTPRQGPRVLRSRAAGIRVMGAQALDDAVGGAA
jgi:hypothetical protein